MANIMAHLLFKHVRRQSVFSKQAKHSAHANLIEIVFAAGRLGLFSRLLSLVAAVLAVYVGEPQYVKVLFLLWARQVFFACFALQEIIVHTDRPHLVLLASAESLAHARLIANLPLFHEENKKVSSSLAWEDTGRDR